jgi:2-hydroxychromene-2-carboxylate isomerase
MAGAAIDFYFDFSSPYGYLAATQMDGFAARTGRAINWRPILLGAVFKVSGQTPLMEIPLKGAYSKRDFARSARLLGVPFSLPPVFPFMSVGACRCFYWLDGRDKALAVRFARAAYAASWTGGKDISRSEVVGEIAASIGVPGEDVQAALVAPEVKEKLRQEVDAAIAAGVFGSPYLIIDGEPFWGADRLEQAERWAKTGGW